MHVPYRIIITTSDKYLPTLKPLIWLVNKYWCPAPEVVIGGFAVPDFELPSNFTFISLGKQEDYPIDKWSDALIELLNRIPDRVILYMLEDMWPIRSVNTPALRMLYDYMCQFDYVAKMDLCADRLYAHGMKSYGYDGYLDLISSMPGSPYHLSLMPGFWRKEHLLSVLIENETPWDVEMKGTVRLSYKREMLVLGTRQWPLRITLAHRGGDSGKLLLDELTEEDVYAMKELGILETNR